MALVCKQLPVLVVPSKIQLKQQTLQPGESRQMPVVFVIESGLPKDVGTITLSYSFFEVEGAGKKAG